jgi:hypothetical protein
MLPAVPPLRFVPVVAPARTGGGYVAWPTTPELDEAPTDVAQGEVVIFLFEDSEEEALQRLKRAITLALIQCTAPPVAPQS